MRVINILSHKLPVCFYKINCLQCVYLNIHIQHLSLQWIELKRHVDVCFSMTNVSTALVLSVLSYMSDKVNVGSWSSLSPTEALSWTCLLHLWFHWLGPCAGRGGEWGRWCLWLSKSRGTIGEESRSELMLQESLTFILLLSLLKVILYFDSCQFDDFNTYKYVFWFLDV